MVLMYGEHNGRSVHDRQSKGARFPHQPVVPINPPVHQRRNILIKTAGKDKVVDFIGTSLPSAFTSDLGKRVLPIRLRKLELCRNVRVAAPADHQKTLS